MKYKQDKYDKMKKNLSNVSQKLEGKTKNMTLISVNSRTLKKYIFC